MGEDATGQRNGRYMMVAREGWCRRHPASGEYESMHKRDYLHIDRKDFWEQASRLLCSRYDIHEETMVVITGDRARLKETGYDTKGMRGL